MLTKASLNKVLKFAVCKVLSTNFEFMLEWDKRGFIFYNGVHLWNFYFVKRGFLVGNKVFFALVASLR